MPPALWQCPRKAAARSTQQRVGEAAPRAEDTWPLCRAAGLRVNRAEVLPTRSKRKGRHGARRAGDHGVWGRCFAVQSNCFILSRSVIVSRWSEFVYLVALYSSPSVRQPLPLCMMVQHIEKWRDLLLSSPRSARVTSEHDP